MLLNEDREKCCGCGACMEADRNQYQIIGMDRDPLHFYYGMHSVSHKVNDEWKKVCPYHSHKQLETIKREVYHSDKYSSQEMLYVLAKTIIEKDGVVYGLTTDEESDIINYRVDSNEDIDKLQLLYYVQPITFIYGDIKKDLDEGKTVLVCDIPCKLEGLRLFLEKDYDNLITLGVKCNGVASHYLWKEYLAYRERKAGDKINKVGIIKPQEKKELKLSFQNGKVYQKEIVDDMFFKMISTGTGIRISCKECALRLNNQISDMELDFENINIAINTSKGKKLLLESINDLKFVDVDLKEIQVKCRLYNEDEQDQIVSRLKAWPHGLFLNHYSKEIVKN